MQLLIQETLVCALLNMSGELIGINSAKLSDTDVEGMGYAIAISDVKNSINTMPQGKDVSKIIDTIFHIITK